MLQAEALRNAEAEYERTEKLVRAGVSSKWNLIARLPSATPPVHCLKQRVNRVP